MNREQFIEQMEKSLLRLPKSARDDILEDYEAHFTIGAEQGKTEEQISAELGNPEELAKTYLENLPVGSKGAEYIPVVEKTEETKSNQNTETTGSYAGYQPPKTDNLEKGNADKSGNIAIVVLLSLFVALPVVGVIISIFFTVVGFIAAAFGVSIGMFVLSVAGSLGSAVLSIGLMFLALAALAVTGLLIVASIAIVKWTVRLIKWYVGVCKNIINGGAI